MVVAVLPTVFSKARNVPTKFLMLMGAGFFPFNNAMKVKSPVRKHMMKWDAPNKACVFRKGMRVVVSINAPNLSSITRDAWCMMTCSVKKAKRDVLNHMTRSVAFFLQNALKNANHPNLILWDVRF